MAAGLPLPKTIVAHGWLLFEESKMSKSRGNIVRTETILDAFGPSSLTPPARPGSLRRRRAALLPAARNCLRSGWQLQLRRARPALQLRPRQRLRQPRQPHAHHDREIFRRRRPRRRPRRRAPRSRRCRSHRHHPSATSHRSNSRSPSNRSGSSSPKPTAFITATAPWKLGATPDDAAARQKLASILYASAESIRIITALLYPVLPFSAAKSLGATRPRRHSKSRPQKSHLGIPHARHQARRTRPRFSPR